MRDWSWNLAGCELRDPARRCRQVSAREVFQTDVRNLPFRDRWFDLVSSMGVVIHQPDLTPPVVMSEMVRPSARWVLLGECFADETTEVPYRGRGCTVQARLRILFRIGARRIRFPQQGRLGRRHLVVSQPMSPDASQRR